MKWARTNSVAVLLAGTLLGFLVGCEPKIGRPGGRPSGGIPQPSASELPPIDGLMQFCDETAEALVKELSSIPEVTSARQRLVLELGGINNKTETSVSDYFMIQRRLQGKLTQSDILKAAFMIVETPERIDAENRRIYGDASGGLLQDVKAVPGRNRYDPNISYVLTGDFYQATRLNQRRYLFQFSLTNLASGKIVFQKSYDDARETPIRKR